MFAFDSEGVHVDAAAVIMYACKPVGKEHQKTAAWLSIHQCSDRVVQVLKLVKLYRDTEVKIRTTIEA